VVASTAVIRLTVAVKLMLPVCEKEESW
jgi:hypothetical protein